MLATILVPLPIAIIFVMVASKHEQVFKYLAPIGFTTSMIFSIVLDFKDVFGEMQSINITYKQVLILQLYLLYACFFTTDYLLMTGTRVIMFGSASISWLMALHRRLQSVDIEEQVPVGEFALLIAVMGTIIEVCTYVNYKQTAELYLKAKISEQQQNMLQCMFDVLPDSILVYPKSNPEETKYTNPDPDSTKETAKT